MTLWRLLRSILTPCAHLDSHFTPANLMRGGSNEVISIPSWLSRCSGYGDAFNSKARMHNPRSWFTTRCTWVHLLVICACFGVRRQTTSCMSSPLFIPASHLTASKLDLEELFRYACRTRFCSTSSSTGYPEGKYSYTQLSLGAVGVLAPTNESHDLAPSKLPT